MPRSASASSTWRLYSAAAGVTVGTGFFTSATGAAGAGAGVIFFSATVVGVGVGSDLRRFRRYFRARHRNAIGAFWLLFVCWCAVDGRLGIRHHGLWHWRRHLRRGRFRLRTAVQFACGLKHRTQLIHAEDNYANQHQRQKHSKKRVFLLRLFYRNHCSGSPHRGCLHRRCRAILQRTDCRRKIRIVR